MKSCVPVLFVLFIGSVFVEIIVEGTSGKGNFKIEAPSANSSTIVTLNSTCNQTTTGEFTSCSLMCFANCNDSLSQVKPRWIYKANDSAIDYCLLTDGVSGNKSSNGYYLTLDLTDYRSGVYIANFSCSGQPYVNCSFHVASGAGVYLGDSCNASQNCTALNAECTGQMCVCPTNFPVQKTDSKNTSSCLPHVSPGSACMTDGQCGNGDPKMICRKLKEDSEYGKCACELPSHLEYVIEMGQQRCVTYEGYMDPCNYDEDCDHFDIDRECNSDGRCDCSYGYYYDDFYGECLYNPWTAYFSVTAVIGIVFGVILLVILIFVALALCLRPSMLRRRSPPPPPPSTTIENQFSSFNEPSVVWTAGERPAYPMDGPPNYTEAGGLDTPPPPFESDVVIKTRLDDIPMENDSTNNPIQEEPLDQQFGYQWLSQQTQPTQVQHQQLDFYTPQPLPSQMEQEQQLQMSPNAKDDFNSNNSFFFQNPHYQTNTAFEADC